ncbi:hypothetical protein MVEN_02240300 [Mycena venus]|uniref:Uncharacterized protein n=1 Tax=Mycena venus TaxID=2733690 RepID=A0A8H6X6I4_9AGAR|nr:hypothetical protein MVEN_02240300 [Mycena venus]
MIYHTSQSRVSEMSDETNPPPILPIVHIPRPLLIPRFSAPPATINLQLDPWSSNTGKLWYACRVLRSPKRAAELVKTITADNSLSNGSIHTILQDMPGFSPTRWVSGMKCLAHLHNLGIKANVLDTHRDVPAKL